VDIPLIRLEDGQIGDVACWGVAAIFVILLLVLLALFYYNRRVFGLKPVQHLCEYCGHMVNAVSHCHHAPVRERFLHGICQQCRGECRLVCQRCKRPL
jgi:hypothetical protein